LYTKTEIDHLVGDILKRATRVARKKTTEVQENMQENE